MIALLLALTAFAADWKAVDLDLAERRYGAVTPVVIEALDSDDPAEQAAGWVRMGDLCLDHDLPYAALLAWSRATPDLLGARRLAQALDIAAGLGESELLEARLTTLPNGLAEPVRTRAAVLGAQHHLRQGELEDALLLLARLPKDNPDFARGMNLKGVVLGQQGKYSEALAALLVAEAAAVDAPLETRAQISLNTGRAYYGAGNYLKAIEHFAAVPRPSLAWQEAQFERAWSHFMIEDYVGAMSMLESLRTPWFGEWYWAEADMVRVWSLFLTCKFPTAQAEIEAFAARYDPLSKGLLIAGDTTPEQAWADLEHLIAEQPTTLPAAVLHPVRWQTRTRDAITALATADDELSRIGEHDWAGRLGALLVGRQDHLRAREGARILARAKAAQVESTELVDAARLLKLDILDRQTEMYTRAAATGELEYGDRLGRLRSLRKKKNTRSWPAQDEVWADEIGYYRVDARSDCPEDQPK